MNSKEFTYRSLAATGIMVSAALFTTGTTVADILLFDIDANAPGAGTL